MATEQDWANDRYAFVEGREGASSGLLAGQFVSLAERLLEATTVHEVLRRVVDAGRAVVAGADLVSVTMRSSEGGFHTPVETDMMATRLDELQYSLDEGPCVEATRTPGLGLIACADLQAGAEFPRWGPAAATTGARSVLAVGLFPAGEAPRLGALNFYSFAVDGFAAADPDIALILAAHASTALAATKGSTAAELEVAQLKEALASRDVIGQAKGILMERRGISAAEAFDVLRSASQSLNVKLAQVAQTIASRRAEL
ncbi:MAG: ANTAR domain-containing protein [Pseudonocardia sp.]|uniref:ANTAR domain-containing protein n=1 Tax=unclassified Pseudonocardia TaxID=2619320 RepID=UPI00086F9880|nr:MULTISPECIES: ANTAR domain-containing protein [unclassified Pseudonocardia]MBN9112613.1 ANTAR domain-containing protein [Pseudonocardia sp.]ODU24873.1 MAG: histidine kinase [Pseudonocardia sp. SCN 72-51]ODV04713.1 MAG: histidine kinase [Pseudonocardia sp. SCN 73-27]